MTVYPSNRGIRTLLIAEYASFVFAAGGRPGTGGGKAVTKVLNAVAGTEASTECVSFMFVTRCMKGERISDGSLSTRAPTLEEVQLCRLSDATHSYHLIA